MKNVINAIELQQEKLDAVKLILKTIDTADHNQSTSDMLKELRRNVEILILSDF